MAWCGPSWKFENARLDRARRREGRFSARIPPMSEAWYVLPDGGYKRISATEDLVSDMQSTVEDIEDTFAAFRAISSDFREIRETSRQLVEQSRRERRLRNSALRLVRRVSDPKPPNL